MFGVECMSSACGLFHVFIDLIVVFGARDIVAVFVFQVVEVRGLLGYDGIGAEIALGVKEAIGRA